MSDYTIITRCANGHEQRTLYQGFDMEHVAFQAGLLDGSSPAFVHKPGPESKCGICKAQLVCEVQPGDHRGISEQINDLADESNPRRCPTCESIMHHPRLARYRCPRGCC